MEKRKDERQETEAPVLCRYFSTRKPNAAVDGKMLNYGLSGAYLESEVDFKEGASLLVRIRRCPSQSSDRRLSEGFRMVAIAEVRWSKPLGTDDAACYGIGLKYY